MSVWSMLFGQPTATLTRHAPPDAAGQSTWNRLKTRLQALEGQGKLTPGSVLRTRAGCLTLCRGGPILIVYPEGVWYRAVTPEVCDEIVTRHVLGGEVVDEHLLAVNPLFWPASEERDEDAPAE